MYKSQKAFYFSTVGISRRHSFDANKKTNKKRKYRSKKKMSKTGIYCRMKKKSVVWNNEAIGFIYS